ncbi:isoleucine--tRNA ligase, mitochondrial [Trichonephila clavata]|uniref:isoleucine--tRNA ligase n=1 Tax=Trichonephila clavata TaxID=2740835 RepID=A0A8X6HNH6_TRICU|nr:isoleucine--tRNA ligase, mitochondrial [Trichonephila clavata]
MHFSKQILFRKNFLNHNKFIFCQKSSSSFKNTLLLPRTTFPHKVSSEKRRQKDHSIEIDAKFEKLYNKQREKLGNKEFILHDGPPYANGDVHIGHAVNKILKDITIRSELIKGKRIHFTPGWDCHGLPIELKVLKENYKSPSDTSQIDIRKKAFSFSQKVKEKQKSSFMEWGILADWPNSYFTCDPMYVIKQLNTFQDLYEKGIILRDHKPVFWSPVNRTSLAEAELEYNSNHVSPSVFVKFSVIKCPDVIKATLDPESKLNVVIWTTTPWTLPANQAVCYSPKQKYCVAFCSAKKEFYVLACEMLKDLEKTMKTELNIITTFEGALLKEVTYSHPILKDRECPLLPANHVTMDKGTGLVHTAPNHGLDDYTVVKKEQIPLDPCIVNEDGCYNSHTIKDFQGKSVLDDGSKLVLDFLVNDILHLEDYKHSYPYDWRSKTPVILRSCHQWFIDVNQIRAKALKSLQNVNIVPDHFKKVFQHQLESSPQWCISRQRAWGVPIPAFYSSDQNKPLVHRTLTNHLCTLIQKHGIHCWWEKDEIDLFPPHLKNQLKLPDEIYFKGSDIMDIWFDSGISWKCVLPEPHISDICIEGVDQIRGWFNSSLLTSVAIRGAAPYKTLVLHGFTTDSEGRKMSKSEGNVISPEDILSGSKKNKIPPYGIDVLRWWVAAHACQSENIAVKMEIFDECAQNLNKVRNVFKFLLGNLNEYNPLVHTTLASDMRALDLYMLHALKSFHQKVEKQYSLIQYKGVTKDILNFVTNEVSSFYCHLVKDRLYCDAEHSKERLDCQTVLHFILSTLIQSIGPLCPHLAEEIFLCLPYKNDAGSVFEFKWPNLNQFLENTTLPISVLWANQIRDVILKSDVKTIEREAIVTCSSKIADELQNLNKSAIDNAGLKEFFQVSDIKFAKCHDNLSEGLVTLNGDLNLSNGVNESFTVSLVKTKQEKCPRCRLFTTSSQTSLCNRCADVLNVRVSQESSV